MERGEIRYINRPGSVGAEIYADGRPAIIVSCDSLAHRAPVQQVVFLTRAPKRDMREHVTIRSTGSISTALCEQVTTVDNSCIGDLAGICTAAEMRQIDIAIASGLGLNFTADGSSDKCSEAEAEALRRADRAEQEVARLKAEATISDRYINNLLDRMTGVLA